MDTIFFPYREMGEHARGCAQTGPAAAAEVRRKLRGSDLREA
jgi:hypothetical protein